MSHDLIINITGGAVLQLLQAVQANGAANGRWVARQCRNQHGGSLSYWRGLARVLKHRYLLTQYRPYADPMLTQYRPYADPMLTQY